MMKRHPRGRKKLSPLSIALLAVLCLLVLGAELLTPVSPAPAQDTFAASGAEGTLEVRFLDIGQGDAALLTCGGQTLLIDGGKVKENQYLVARLKDLGVARFDAIICSHPDEDHCGGLAAVLANFPCENFFCSADTWHTKAFQDVMKYAEAQELSILVPEPGSFFSLGEAGVEFLGPVEDYEDDANEGSLVVRVRLGDTSVLFTGDMGFEAEDDMRAQGVDVSATVLKVAHHGSAGSSSREFLAAVGAEYGVISVGADNDYGHPTEAALNRLSSQGMTLYRTDLLGEIVCTLDGQTVTFSSQKDVRSQTTQAVRAGAYVANSSSMVVHSASCQKLPAEENRLYFDTLEAALAAGCRTHKACLGS